MLDYWRMKMGGVYLYHKGKYLYCEDVMLKDYQHNEDHEHPEDILPYCRFICGKKTLKFEDFEIKFPKDSYVLDGNNRLVFGYRHMNRQYKLGPSGENFRLEPGRINLDEYLRRSEEVTMSAPGELFDFSEQRDHIFTPLIASKHKGRLTRMLVYNNTPIAQVKRNKMSITVSYTQESHFPREALKLFGSQIAEGRTKAPEFEGFDEVRSEDFIIAGDGRQTTNHWALVDTSDIHSNNTPEYSIAIDQGDDDRIFMMVKVNEGVYDVDGSTDLRFLVDHNRLSRSQYEDLLLIYQNGENVVA